MKHLRFTTRTNARSGFSLIEIMVALVVIAVGLISIVGLIPQGVQSSRSAADNTLVATIVHDIFNTIRSEPFNNVTLSGFGFNTPAPPYNLLVAGSGTAYFDGNGSLPATAADNYYKVVLNFVPNGTLPLSVVTAIVVWPAKAAVPANTNVFFTQIANYRQ